MGLTIYYRMKMKADADAARKLVGKMHQRIRKLAWDKVSEVFEIDPPDGKYAFEKMEADGFKPGTEYLTRKRDDGEEELVEVPSLHVIYFAAQVKGAELAKFGLASRPPVVVHREDVIEHEADGSETTYRAAGKPVEVPTRLRGWYSWQDFCKTQYAAHPKLGGEENFLRAHLTLFAAMEICKDLGLKTWVRDDGEYYKYGSVEKLLESLRRHDELVAGFVGAVDDVLGKSAGGTVAPIKDRPDFEHLEARGVERMRKRGRGKK